MCTMIAETASIRGSGKGPSGWFEVSRATVGYDHPTHVPLEHALLLDFMNPALGVDARVAVELSLASARTLIEQLQMTVAAAERSGVTE